MPDRTPIPPARRGGALLMAPKGPKHWRLVLLNLATTFAFGAVLVVGAVSLLFYEVTAMGLPKLDSLRDYRPNLVTEVYDRHGTLIGEFMYESQRRYLMPIDEAPPMVINAFIAAEDRGFFTHQGLDYLGIIRAAWTNVQAGTIKQGGSTITQQVVKSLLLTPEKTYLRKMREMLLAKRIEDRLTKHEILYLYLNQIYFGGGAYGLRAAAREFFGKDVAELTLAEAALLAGLVQAPGRYDPRAQPDKALTRRHYVLTRMWEDGFIDEGSFRQAVAAPLGVREHHDVNREAAPDFVEQVRRLLMKKYGAERVLKEGWRVTTTCDLRLQQLAREAVRRGLRAHAKRQGLLALPDPVSVVDRPKHLQALKRRNQSLGSEEVREGLVSSADDGGVRVDLGATTVRLTAAQMRWVNKVQRGEAIAPAAGRRPGQLLHAGDRVLVYREGGDYVLAAWPAAEGALAAMDVENRAVLALIGGRDFEGSEFNRALQAKRQPGSAFKPIVYAAALAAGLTPATVFADTALVFADNWRPANYDHVFRGYMTLRQALTHSVNTVTIRVAEMVGVDYLARFARRLGIRSIRGGDLSMAIGTYELTPMELINAYAVFAAGGRLGEPTYVQRIVDRDGNLIEEARVSEFVERAPALEGAPDLRHRGVVDQPSAAAGVASEQENRLLEFLRSLGVGGQKTPTPTPEPEESPEPRGEIPARALQEGGAVWRQVVDPQVAYVITSMMHSVATEGTGAKSNVLKRTLAGKTGTTNDYKDAWFVGFSPQVIAGVWVGFDKGANVLGGGESGSTTALPIWIEFMKAALEDQPNTPFVSPPGLVVARVDPQTGLLAPPDSPGISEIFVPGTEPTEYAPAAASPLPQDFFNQELGND